MSSKAKNKKYYREFECAFCGEKFYLSEDEKFRDHNIEGRAYGHYCNAQDNPEYNRIVYGSGGSWETRY